MSIEERSDSVENIESNSPELLVEFVAKFDKDLRPALDSFIGSRNSGEQHKKKVSLEMMSKLSVYFRDLFEAQKLSMGNNYDEYYSRSIPGYEYAQSLMSEMGRDPESDLSYKTAEQFLSVMKGVDSTLKFLKPREKRD